MRTGLVRAASLHSTWGTAYDRAAKMQSVQTLIKSTGHIIDEYSHSSCAKACAAPRPGSYMVLQTTAQELVVERAFAPLVLNRAPCSAWLGLLRPPGLSWPEPMKCRKLLKRLRCHVPDCGLAGAASQEQGCCAVLTTSMSEQAH